jgi:dipeptidyl aminopeptidase/acylaminoacyl peptidase
VQQPYGTWPSPITARVVAAQGLRLGGVCIDGRDIYWLEGRPDDGGRVVLVRRTRDGVVADVTPAGFNVRTRVHEYGGGAYAVSGGHVYFTNFADQRIYAIRGGSRAPEPSDTTTEGDHCEPRPMTPEGQWFYADLVVDAPRGRLVCVREDHTDPSREPVNTLVSLPLHGASSGGEILASGHDFYSTPRLSPDGSTLAWLAWRHPQMPWDGTELWIAEVNGSGALVSPVLVAGGPSESIYQPGWSPDGTLYYVSDRNGWWTLVRRNGSTISNVLNDSGAWNDSEFGRPQWIFGSATWAFAGPSRIVACYTRAGGWHLAEIDVPSGTMRDIAPELEPGEWLAATETEAVLVAGSATQAEAVVRIDLATGAAETLRRSSTLELDPAGVSVPEAIAFPSGPAGATTHAFFYPPRHAAFTGLPTERPPLIAISHGGPTTAAKATLDLKIQFWTSRGFAVVDVNYGGSSGYGRAYRERLRGNWGIVDVEDTVNAARYLVSQGKADPERLIVRGGSAGGYTTLAALAFRPGVFKAGASHYGISDIEVLARDTHKFESRYLDSLIGPYPERRDLYRARSPIHFVDRLSCALILFQGLDDKVVPPNQSAMMAEAVRAKGLPVAYLAFEGEQHGFRRAETIVRSLEAELFFHGAVFGFVPTDDIEPVAIANLR